MRELVVDLRRLTRRSCDSDSSRAAEGTSARGVQFAVRAWTTKALLGIVALAMTAGVTYFLLRLRTESGSVARDISFMQLTDQAGPEIFPSLSPDGRSFVYAARPSDNWDIYLQRVDGKNPINLTKDSSADDTPPSRRMGSVLRFAPNETAAEFS